MKEENLKNLCERIVAKNGRVSCRDILECGYTMEHFIRMADNNIDNKKLVQTAQKVLSEMEG